MQRRIKFSAGAAGMALGLVLFGFGCGGKADGPGAAQSGLNVLIGERLGALVAQDAAPGAEVILVHLSRSPKEVEQWITGLNRGMGNGATVVELGPAQLPAEAKGAMGGYPPLYQALKQYPNAAAIITALPVGAYEQPTFPTQHPPIYALGWSYLPDSIYLFRGEHLVAGVFEQPELDPARDLDPSQSPEDLFDRNYVVVTPENLRELVGQH